MNNILYIIFSLSFSTAIITFIMWIISKLRKKQSAAKLKRILLISTSTFLICTILGAIFIPSSELKPPKDKAKKVEQNKSKPKNTAKQKPPKPKKQKPSKPKKQKQSKSKPKPKQKKKTTKRISFADIYRAYQKNELRAKKLYGGKRHKITAKINGIKAGRWLGLFGGANLTMETKVDNTIVFFIAEFNKDQENALMRVSVGDTITFVGTCYGGSFSDCELK